MTNNASGSLLWLKARETLSPKDQEVIPANLMVKPEELLVDVEKQIARAKGKPVKLPNGESFFVRDILGKVSQWVKAFIAVGDTAMPYDPTGHAAVPWALLRLILQISVNNMDNHVAMLEGVEQVSYYLVWSRIEEKFLAVTFEAQDELEKNFVQLYSVLLSFMARSIRFLRKKTQRLVAAIFSSDSIFRDDVASMAKQKLTIESFTRQIINQIGQEQYDEVKMVKEQLAELEKPVLRAEGLIVAASSAIDRQERDNILNWASDIPFQKHFRVVEEKALSGTGTWFFEDLDFSTWQTSSRSQMLWLHGNSGSGKSTLTALIIRSLIDAHEKYQAPYPMYFFCSRTTAEPKRADPEQILRSLTRQVSDLFGGPPLHPSLRQTYDQQRPAGDLSAEEATRIILAAIEDRPVSYILVDALDECDRQTRDVLIDSLKDILAKSSSLVKIFVTSRDSHQDIALSMEDYPALCIDASRNRADIDHYIRHSVKSAISKRKLLPTERISKDLQEKIEDSLRSGAAGMFRWVALQLQFLCTLRKRSVLLDRLGKLPPGLEKIYGELYEYNMSELGEEQFEVVKRILSWLLVAQRPLSTSELCQLVCAPEEPDMTNETILDMCFDLIRLDTGQDQFIFSHLSVREFLETRSSDHAPAILHPMATSSCLHLVMSQGLDSREDYAAVYWPIHAEVATKAGSGQQIEPLLDEFLCSPVTSFLEWGGLISPLQSFIFQAMSEAERRVAAVVAGEGASAFFVAACFGLSAQFSQIISKSEELHVLLKLHNNKDQDALYLAAQHGHCGIVKMLLDRGAITNVQAALQVASEGGHEDVVNSLLDTGMDINAIAIRPDGEYVKSALQAASEKGKVGTVGLLLDRGADVNAQGQAQCSALHAASSGGSYETAKLLLERGADIDAIGERYGTALQAAAYSARIEVADLLLGRGADANGRHGQPGTALQIASAGGPENMVRLLLDRGADVNAPGFGLYGGAFQMAILNQQRDIARLLFDRGADVNAQGGACGNPLEIASARDDKDMLRLLIDNGADVNSGALQEASRTGSRDTVMLLLDMGADVNAQRGSKFPRDSALRVASGKGDEDTVRLLLDRGADANQGGERGNALGLASEKGHENVIGLLLESGADINAEGSEYGTALQIASQWGRENVIRLLVEIGADVNVKGDSPLACASIHGNEGLVKLLLDRGADATVQGAEALLKASYYGHQGIVKLLLDRGVDVNAGEVILDAASEGHEETVKLLLDRGADVNPGRGNLLCCAMREEENVGLVQSLLDRGADLNAQGSVALRDASRMGYEGIVKLLLDRGVDVNAEAALQAASETGHEETAKLLLDRGADVNASGGNHKWYGNALQAASGEGKVELVKLLLEHGADINVQVEGRYRSSLLAALLNGQEGTAKLLLDRGADFDAQGAAQALLNASSSGHEGMARLLLDLGADVDARGIKNKKICTALQAAAGAGDEALVQLLLDRGADVQAHGAEALESALANNKLGTAKLLADRGVVRR